MDSYAQACVFAAALSAVFGLSGQRDAMLFCAAFGLPLGHIICLRSQFKTGLALQLEKRSPPAPRPRLDASKISPRPDIAWPTVALALVALALWVVSFAARIAGVLGGSSGFCVAFVSAFVCFTPLHDAVHNSVAPKLSWLNNAVGSLCGIPLFAPFRVFKLIHLMHHRHANEGAADPDSYAGEGPEWQLPLRWASTFQYYVAYASAYTRFVRRDGAPKSAALEAQKRLVRRTESDFMRFHLSVLGVGSFLCLRGHAAALLTQWVLPQVAASLLLVFSFDYIPHRPHKVAFRDSPYLATHITTLGLEQLLGRPSIDVLETIRAAASSPGRSASKGGQGASRGVLIPAVRAPSPASGAASSSRPATPVSPAANLQDASEDAATAAAPDDGGTPRGARDDGAPRESSTPDCDSERRLPPRFGRVGALRAETSAKGCVKALEQLVKDDVEALRAYAVDLARRIDGGSRCERFGRALLSILLLNQNYHNVHHLWPSQPWYRYSKVWFAHNRELLQKGVRVLPLVLFPTRATWLDELVVDEQVQASLSAAYAKAHTKEEVVAELFAQLGLDDASFRGASLAESASALAPFAPATRPREGPR